MSWLPKQCVVVPVDFSDESFAALEVALANFVTGAVNLRVIYVLPPLIPSEPGVIWETIDETGRREHAIDALRERLSDPKYQGLVLEVGVGDPARQIAEFAQDVQAELIVLPSHGRTGITRFLIGSVAERVVRLAHCPVLVLRK